MPHHRLLNFELQRYRQKEPEFNGSYSRSDLPRLKDGAYVINQNKCKSIGSHWIALYVNGYNVTKIKSFGVEYVPKKS